MSPTSAKLNGGTRVLVVDDSPFARRVVTDSLGKAGFQVVGIAGDGLEALEQIHALSPDVITLDLLMPGLDGLGVLKALAGRPSPRVVVVSASGNEAGLGAAALNAGAFDIVDKPTAATADQLYEMAARLVEVVAAAARARRR